MKCLGEVIPTSTGTARSLGCGPPTSPICTSKHFSRSIPASTSPVWKRFSFPARWWNLGFQWPDLRLDDILWSFEAGSSCQARLGFTPLGEGEQGAYNARGGMHASGISMKPGRTRILEGYRIFIDTVCFSRGTSILPIVELIQPLSRWLRIVPKTTIQFSS